MIGDVLTVAAAATAAGRATVPTDLAAVAPGRRGSLDAMRMRLQLVGVA
jgi:hypothetical protein